MGLGHTTASGMGAAAVAVMRQRSNISGRISLRAPKIVDVSSKSTRASSLAMRNLWIRFVRPFVSYFYYLRVPIIGWLLGTLLAPFAISSSSPANALLRGVFDITSGVSGGLRSIEWWRASFAFFLVALAAVMSSRSIYQSIFLIVLFGKERFGLPGIPPPRPVLAALDAPPAGRASWLRTAWARIGRDIGWIDLFVAIPTVSVILGAFLGTPIPRSPKFAGVAAGLAIYLVLLLFSYIASTKGLTSRFRIVRRLLSRCFTGIDRLLGQISPAGYLDSSGCLYEDHRIALYWLMLSVALYAIVGALKYWTRFGSQPWFPTLAMILVWLTLANWFIAALAFFFDRAHIPLVALFGGYILVVSLAADADHSFAVSQIRPGPMPQLSPGSAFGVNIDSQRAVKVIIVAAAGGGIQASAWTAQVLTGLVEASRKRFNDDRFDRSLRLISGVSGGSVGSMFLVAAYRDGALPPPTDRRLAEVLTSASASSLDEVAWGLLFPDQWRALFPFGWRALGLETFDRGSVLERSWLRGPMAEDPSDPALSRWREDARIGARPAVIFNSTAAESGKPLLLATTDVRPHAVRTDESVATSDTSQCQPFADASQPELVFTDLYPCVDIAMRTAARESATFPYITPAAKIESRVDTAFRYHHVDGGYYDNYGVVSALQWLNIAFSDRADAGKLPVDVLFIDIISFPADAEPSSVARGGGIFQLTVPLQTQYNVRGAGQAAHANAELSLFIDFARRKWGYQVQRVTFRFSGDPKGPAPPLSWHLKDPEITQIKNEWLSGAIRQKTEEVLKFLEAQ